MRIFVLGGTGYIGSAVVQHLVRAGHAVTGLVRSAERQRQLSALGARAVLGDMKTPSSYRALAGEQDAAVHLAFSSQGPAAPMDRTVVETLLDAALSAGRPYTVLYTSGVLVLGPAGQEPAYEAASTEHAVFNTWRPAHERLVLAATSARVATAVVRPGWVYGGGDGLAAGYFQTAVAEGAAAFIGDGQNRMPLVHREDVAELYCRVLEQRATGIFHAVDGGTGRILDTAAAASLAAGRGGAVRSIPLVEATQTLGPFAEAMCLDQWVGSRRAQTLGWQPRAPFVESAAEAFAEWQSGRPR
ncbi:MAG: NAD-dependent epimerase/dehydratase family protein [Myxococcaceae bacterium]